MRKNQKVKRKIACIMKVRLAGLLYYLFVHEIVKRMCVMRFMRKLLF